MTTDVEAGSPAALHAALLQAAGPERVLTPVALRGLLVGADQTMLVEVLSRIMEEGVGLPPPVVAAFGLRAGSAIPAQPVRPAPTRTVGKAPAKPPLAAIPAQQAPLPRFTVELGPDSRLDFGALTVRALRPDPDRDPAPAPAPQPAPAQAPVEVEHSHEGSAEHEVARVPAPAPEPAPSRPHGSDEAEFDESSARKPEFNPLKYYRSLIGRFPLLSKQREAELAQAIEAGLLAREKLETADRKLAPKLRRDLKQVALLGERAFTEFAQANLRLVVSVAARHTGRGLDLMDLIQEGNIAMVHAIEKFDHRKGFKFSTYAMQWIRQAISRAIADQSRTIRLPVHAHDTVTALHKAARELGHDAPADDLPAVTARAGIPLSKARDLLPQVRRTVPLEDLAEAIGDDALHEEADRTIRGPHWSEPETYYQNLSSDEVHTLLDRLPMREHRVLALRHGLEGSPPLTLDAIGRLLGVTREAVRLIESKAETKLRKLIHEYHNPAIVAPPPAPASCAASPRTAVAPLEVPSVRRKVHASGQFMVARQTINVGVPFSGESVTVLLEDDRFRVLHEGRQIATAPRHHLNGNGKIYGAPD